MKCSPSRHVKQVPSAVLIPLSRSQLFLKLDSHCHTCCAMILLPIVFVVQSSRLVLQGDAPSCWLCSPIASLGNAVWLHRRDDIVQVIEATASTINMPDCGRPLEQFLANVRLVEPMQPAPLHSADMLCTSNPMEPILLVTEVNNLLPVSCSVSEFNNGAFPH